MALKAEQPGAARVSRAGGGGTGHSLSLSRPPAQPGCTPRARLRQVCLCILSRLSLIPTPNRAPPQGWGKRWAHPACSSKTSPPYREPGPDYRGAGHGGAENAGGTRSQPQGEARSTRKGGREERSPLLQKPQQEGPGSDLRKDFPQEGAPALLGRVQRGADGGSGWARRLRRTPAFPVLSPQAAWLLGKRSPAPVVRTYCSLPAEASASSPPPPPRCTGGGGGGTRTDIASPTP